MPDSFAWVSYVLSACLAIGLVLSAGAVGLAQEEKTLIEWKFDQPGNLKGWTPNGHMKDTAVADGRLKTKVIDWDPFLIGPPCDIPATPFQRIEVRMRATGLPEAGTGLAEFFWTNTTETKYGGFSPGKQTPFQVQGDGQWRTYSVHPFWHAEKKIIRLRLDLPRDKGEYEIEWIRVVEEAPGPAATSPRWEFDDGPGGWRASEGVSQMTCKNGLLSLVAASGESRLVSPPLQVQALDNPYVAIRMAVDKGDTAQITFASSKTNGLHKTSFPIKPDGQMRTYNLDLGANARWDDKIIALALRPTMTAGANVRIDFIRISDRPQGPAQIEVSG
ncbi:MAG: hypothetical protein FJ272_09015, partial [Planctomycetes bacterium]|nr:hypothetical protein [Planctomycetota bacterium]